MSLVPFVKYTTCGNNFVIVDETDGPRFREEQFAQLAYQATSQYFGIGCDKLLVVQRSSARTFASINRGHGYWTAPPDPANADLVFRMFEPDGTEALCCGNGLMCIAAYLRDRQGIGSARIYTEIPMPVPQVQSIGASTWGGAAHVNLGVPRATPGTLVDRSRLSPGPAALEHVEDLRVPLRAHDLSPFSDAQELKLDAHLCFTGEPHLVVFPASGVAPHEVAGTFFSSSEPHFTDTGGVCKRVNFGTGVLRRAGHDLNRRQDKLFPSGVNLNVARIDTVNGLIEYRCFERGINRETLACGTGALAVAYTAWALGLTANPRSVVLPHRCRWYESEAVIEVHREDDGSWMLATRPRQVCTGEFDTGVRVAVPHRDVDLAAASQEATAVDLDASKSATAVL